MAARKHKRKRPTVSGDILDGLEYACKALIGLIEAGKVEPSVREAEILARADRWVDETRDYRAFRMQNPAPLISDKRLKEIGEEMLILERERVEEMRQAVTGSESGSESGSE